MREFVQQLTHHVSTTAQLLALIVIVIGMLRAAWSFFKDTIMGEDSHLAISESRLELGHSFSLGLGFLIGASILQTAIAPNWNDIGKLAAIIGIRTILNFFLLREIKAAPVNPLPEARKPEKKR